VFCLCIALGISTAPRAASTNTRQFRQQAVAGIFSTVR
jgi:hypothetical protein